MSRSTSWALPFLTGLLLAGPTPLKAQAPDSPSPEPESVYGLVYTTDASLLSRVATGESALRGALLAERGLRWMGPDARWLGYPSGLLDRVAHGLRDLQAGVALFEDGAYEDARSTLEGALAHLDAGAVVLEDESAWQSALVHLAACQLATGQRREAAQSFRRLARQAPGVTPSSLGFDASVQSAYWSAAEANRERGVLHVRLPEDSNGPVLARVYLDHRYRGIAPLRIRDLPAGSHELRVVTTGHAAYTTRVVVPARRATSHEIQLSQRRWPLSAFPLLPAGLSKDVAQEMAATLGAAHLLLVEVSPAAAPDQLRVRGRLFAAESASTKWATQATIPDDGAALAGLAAEFVQGAAESLRRPAADPEPELPSLAYDEPLEEPPTWVEGWEFWTVLATGVAAVAGGIAAYSATVGEDTDSGSAGIILRF